MAQQQPVSKETALQDGYLLHRYLFVYEIKTWTEITF